MRAKVKVLYVCDFDLRRGTGKNRATAQKLSALKDKVSSLKVMSNSFKSPILQRFALILIDIRAVLHLIAQRPDWFISRGYCGLLSLYVAKRLGLLTVREVHANAMEESALLPYRGIKLKIIKLLTVFSNKMDLAADIRIFNHPDLLQFYKDKGRSGIKDFFTYNGFDPKGKSDLSRVEARKIFGFAEDEKIIVFVGGASKWHGVEYLVALQGEVNRYDDKIKVVFGGGDISEFDPNGFCINLSPLDDQKCATLIRAADFCALPVKQNRVSPGSPLKLYDYIANERFVLAQKDTNGYSDEVEKFGVGRPVDFTDPLVASKQVLDAFEHEWPDHYPNCKASWSDRMDEWVRGISHYEENSNRNKSDTK